MSGATSLDAAIDAAIATRPPLAVTSGAPRRELRAQLRSEVLRIAQERRSRWTSADVTAAAERAESAAACLPLGGVWGAP